MTGTGCDRGSPCSWVPAAAASFAREDLFAAWTAFLEHLAARPRPWCWCSTTPSTPTTGLLDFLDHLLSTAQAPIFVLALARPELLTRRPALGGRRTSVVRLDPLDDVAMAGLVDGLVVGPAGRFPGGTGGSRRRDPAVSRSRRSGR